MATKLENFLSIRDRAEKIVKDDSTRVNLNDEMRKMFMMEWKGEPGADWIRKVISPDAYDTVMGIMRLMMATKPQINVPKPGETETMVADEKMERTLRALLTKADKVREMSVMYDMFLSAILYGEVVVRVGNTDDLIKYAKRTKNKVIEAQAKKIPFTIEAINPGTVFVDTDILGMRRVVIADETTAGKVKEFWGKAVKSSIGTYDDDDEIVLFDYWDRTYRGVWIEGGGNYILFGKHELPFIPVVRAVTQGTNLWNRDVGHNVFPLLYAYKQSGMWNAQNIALTMINSIAYAMGSVPFLALRKKALNQPDPEIDWKRPGINVTLVGEQSIERVLPGGTIPEDMMQVLNLVESKIPEMLMPKVVFGQSIGTNMSFSAINLLSQGGRLPLVPVQERVADALSSVLEIILMWVKEESTTRTFWMDGLKNVLNPSEIDMESLHVDVKISPNIPMDRMQVGTLVSQLVAAKIISVKKGREWLNIFDNTAETEQVLVEHFIASEAETFAKQIGGASDVEDMLPEAVEPELPLGPPVSTEGELFNLNQGGLPQAMMGNIQEIEPLIPGGEGGGPMSSPGVEGGL